MRIDHRTQRGRGALSVTRRSKDVSVSYRKIVEKGKAEADHIVQARDVRDNMFLLLVWEGPDLMAYAQLGAKYLYAIRFWIVAQSWANFEGFSRRKGPCYGFHGQAVASRSRDDCN